MGKAGVVVFIIILIAGLSFIYFNYDYNKNSHELVNVSISAQFNGKLIKTGYEINGNILGNTSRSYELIQLERDIIYISNINIEDQNYYEESFEINLRDNNRIDLILEKAYLPEIEVDYEENLIVEVTSKNFKDVNFCLDGSLNYIFIKAINYTEIPKIKGFETYDKCYDGDFSLKESSEIIEVSYMKFGNPTKSDFISIGIIDKQNNQKIVKIK